jgi:hypothetical protein
MDQPGGWQNVCEGDDEKAVLAELRKRPDADEVMMAAAPAGTQPYAVHPPAGFGRAFRRRF